jgi:hypothetical protein
MANIHIVMIPNGMILAVYATEHHADIHARTVTGSRVLTLPVLQDLLETVREDVASEDWDDNGDTPVQVPKGDTTKTDPGTPRSKAKSRPPRQP